MRNVNDFFRESNYNNLRILLTICGVWPFQAFAKRCAMYVAFTVLFISVMIFEVHREKKRARASVSSFQKHCVQVVKKYLSQFSQINVHFCFLVIFCAIHFFLFYLNISISNGKSKDSTEEITTIFFFLHFVHITIGN